MSMPTTRENTNDIIYETTVYNPNLAFYTNAGRTRRQGVEANLRIRPAAGCTSSWATPTPTPRSKRPCC